MVIKKTRGAKAPLLKAKVMTTEEMKKKLEEKVGRVEVRSYDFVIVHNRKNGVAEYFQSLWGAYKYYFGYFD